MAMPSSDRRKTGGKPQSSCSSKFSWKKGCVAKFSCVKIWLWLTASSGTDGTGRIQAKSEAVPLYRIWTWVVTVPSP